jgi:hypothetical protein
MKISEVSKFAKQVDEILKEFKSDELYSSGENNINDFIIYWQEIKQEIEKLCKDNQ